MFPVAASREQARWRQVLLRQGKEKMPSLPNLGARLHLHCSSIGHDYFRSCYLFFHCCLGQWVSGLLWPPLHLRRRCTNLRLTFDIALWATLGILESSTVGSTV